MSRTEDIAFVEGQIRTIGLQRQKLADDHEVYRKQITSQILKILKDAGVLEAVQALEAVREQRRVDDQAKVDELGKNATELQGVLTFLKARESTEETPAPAAVEAPAPPPKARGKK